jgi:hypothetical protein
MCLARYSQKLEKGHKKLKETLFGLGLYVDEDEKTPRFELILQKEHKILKNYAHELNTYSVYIQKRYPEPSSIL